jgi:hypothetical protein
MESHYGLALFARFINASLAYQMVQNTLKFLLFFIAVGRLNQVTIIP